MALTAGAGVDVAIEAVGIPATFDICQSIVAAGRPHRQHRGPRQAGAAPAGEALVAQHHDHHAPGGHRGHAHAPEDGADRPAAAEEARHPPLPRWMDDHEGLRHVRGSRPREGAQGRSRGPRGKPEVTIWR